MNVSNMKFQKNLSSGGGGGDAVAHLVEALRYKLEGRGFDSR
jgi:hypothetical protein